MGFARDLHDRYGDIVRIGEQDDEPVTFYSHSGTGLCHQLRTRYPLGKSAALPLMDVHGLPKAASTHCSPQPHIPFILTSCILTGWVGCSMHQPIRDWYLSEIMSNMLNGASLGTEHLALMPGRSTFPRYSGAICHFGSQRKRCIRPGNVDYSFLVSD